MDEPTVVIFRRWKRSQDQDEGVIALFPEIPADYQGRFCQSFEHVGQHGGADYHLVVRNSRPASMADRDVISLHDELTHDPYNYQLVVRRRAAWPLHEKRLQEVR